MSTRLTALTIERIKGGAARQEIADAGCPGLYFVVQTSGAKSWAIRARINGKPAKITIGPYPRHDLLTARDLAREMLGLIDQGIDPRQKAEEQRRQQEDEQRQETERVANTLRAVAEQFRDKSMCKTQVRSWHDRWAALDRHILRGLGNRPIQTIRRRDIHEALDLLADKPGARHHTVAALSQLFRWAVDREIVDANPVAAMPRPKVRVRERALTDAEIPIAWKAAEAVGYPFGPYVRMLLLTGCRRGEIAGLRWSEIDLDEGTITIPAERYKTGRTLVVPLSPLARRLIDDMPQFGEGEHLFTTTGGRLPISGFSKFMQRFDATLAKHCEAGGVAPFDFDLHDLRRTVRTNMSALRVQPHIAEAVLGHVVTGIQKHYDKWSYLDEKREALEAWARKVESLINPGRNVTPIEGRRRRGARAR